MAMNIDVSKLLSQGYDAPKMISNILLLEPGKWNDLTYTSEEIKKAFENTDWSNKDNYSLILDHADNPNEAVRNWSGYVKNIKLKEDGKLYGDLEVWNPLVAMYLTEAKAKFGISAKLKGMENKGKLKDFTFENFSIVTKPAVRTAYINLSQDKQNGGNNKMVEIQTLSEVEMTEELAKKKPVDKEPEAKPAEEEMSDVELLAFTINSDWTDFVKKCKAKDPNMNFKDIAKAYKGKTNANLEFEKLSDEELLEKFQVISAALKKRDKYPMPEECAKCAPKGKKVEEAKKEEPVVDPKKEDKKEPALPKEELKKEPEKYPEAVKEEGKKEEPKKDPKEEMPEDEEMKKKNEKKSKDAIDSLNSKSVEQDNKIKELQATIERLSAPDRKTVSLSASASQEASGDVYENMGNFLLRAQGLGGDRRIF